MSKEEELKKKILHLVYSEEDQVEDTGLDVIEYLLDCLHKEET